MMELKEFPTFKQHVRDFLVQVRAAGAATVAERFAACCVCVCVWCCREAAHALEWVGG